MTQLICWWAAVAAVNVPLAFGWAISNQVPVVGLVAAVAGEEPSDEEEVASPVEVARGEDRRVILTVGAEVQERIGLRAASLEAVTRQPSVPAFGLLEDDPGQSATLRAPLNGFLRKAPVGVWPRIGAQVRRGDVVAVVQPRFSSAESFDLFTRWTEAQAEVEQLTAEANAARASFENKQKLNAAGGLVSDRAVEDAEALLKGDEARLSAARKKASMIEGMLTGGGDIERVFELTAPTDGIVADVLASLDESVDSGQPLLRVTNPQRLIARVHLPVGNPVPAQDAEAQIVMVGDDDRVLTGAPLGLAAMRDLTTRGPTLLFGVEAEGEAALRAGTPVTAHVPLPGKAAAGVMIPRSAIIRLGGLTWVYAQTADDTFERREVTLVAPEPDGWFVETGASAGDAIVVAGAQLLLSEEQKAQIESEEEASE